MPQCVRLFSWNNKSQCNNRITIMIYYFKQNRAHTHCYCCCLRSFFANCNKSFNHPQGFAFARKQQQIMQTNQQTTGKCFLEINWMRVQWFIVQLTRKSLWTNFNWVFFSANSNKIRSKKRSRLNVCMSFPMRIWVRTKMIAIKFTVVSFFPHYVQWTHFVRFYCRQK